MLLHHVLTTLDRVNHTLDVKHLSLDPKCGLCERRLVALDGVVELGGHITSIGIGKDTLVLLVVAEEFDGDLLKLNELLVDARVVVKGFGVLLSCVVQHKSIFLHKTRGLGSLKNLRSYQGQPCRGRS